MSYRWQVGDGSKIRFWEGHWFGSCSLAIQYWEIFSIVNEHDCTIREVWDGTNLRLLLEELWAEGFWTSGMSYNKLPVVSASQESLMQSFGNLIFLGDIRSNLYAIINDRVWDKCSHRLCEKFLFLLGFIFFCGWLLITRFSLEITWVRETLEDKTCLFWNWNCKSSFLWLLCSKVCLGDHVWYFEGPDRSRLWINCKIVVAE
jgi:hypothetical protein